VDESTASIAAWQGLLTANSAISLDGRFGEKKGCVKPQPFSEDQIRTARS
jgi:hypothetical protein